MNLVYTAIILFASIFSSKADEYIFNEFDQLHLYRAWKAQDVSVDVHFASNMRLSDEWKKYSVADYDSFLVQQIIKLKKTFSTLGIDLPLITEEKLFNPNLTCIKSDYDGDHCLNLQVTEENYNKTSCKNVFTQLYNLYAIAPPSTIEQQYKLTMASTIRHYYANVVCYYSNGGKAEETVSSLQQTYDNNFHQIVVYFKNHYDRVVEARWENVTRWVHQSAVGQPKFTKKVQDLLEDNIPDWRSVVVISAEVESSKKYELVNRYPNFNRTRVFRRPGRNELVVVSRNTNSSQEAYVEAETCSNEVKEKHDHFGQNLTIEGLKEGMKHCLSGQNLVADQVILYESKTQVHIRPTSTKAVHIDYIQTSGHLNSGVLITIF